VVIVVGIFILGFALAIKATRVVKSYERAFCRYRGAFQDGDAKDSPADPAEIAIRQVVDDYRAAITPGGPRPDATALVTARLGALAMTQERWVKFLASTCVAVGLLGTFIGLVIALQGVNKGLDQLGSIRPVSQAQEDGSTTSPNQSSGDTDPTSVDEGVSESDDKGSNDLVQTTIDALEKPLGGMGTAFISSVFGLVASIILGGSMAYCNLSGRRVALCDDVESFLHTTVFPRVYSNPMGDIMNQLGRHIETAFDDSMKNLGEEIRALSDLILRTLGGLDDITASLAASGGAFDSSTARLVRFNEELDKSINQLEESTRLAVDVHARTAQAINEFQEHLTHVEEMEARRTEEFRNTLDQVSMELQLTWDKAQTSFEAMNDRNERSVAALSAQITHLQSTTEGLVGVVDTLGNATENVAAALDEAQSSWADAAQHHVEELERAARQTSDNLVNVVATIERDLAETFADLRAQTITVLEDLVQRDREVASDLLSQTSGVAESLLQVTVDLSEQVGMLREDQGDVIQAIEGVMKGASVLQEVARESREVMEAMLKKWTDETFNRANKHLNDLAEKALSAERLIVNQMERIHDAIEELKDAYHADMRTALFLNGDTMQEMQSWLDRASGSFNRFGREIADLSTALKEAVDEISRQNERSGSRLLGLRRGAQ